MTADARRDEALRLVDEAIAEAHEAFVAVGGDWKRAGMDVYSQVSALQSRRVAALDDGNQIPQHVADFIAANSPQAMLRLHRANKALLGAHFVRGRSILGYPVCNACLPLVEWPCPTAVRVIDAYLGDAT